MEYRVLCTLIALALGPVLVLGQSGGGLYRDLERLLAQWNQEHQEQCDAGKAAACFDLALSYEEGSGVQKAGSPPAPAAGPQLETARCSEGRPPGPTCSALSAAAP